MSVSDRFKEGEQLAFDVLKQFWSDGGSEKTVSLPVDPVDIASQMNIVVETAVLPDTHIASVLVKDDDMKHPRLILAKGLTQAISDARYVCAFNIAHVLDNITKTKFGVVTLRNGSFDDDFARGFSEGLIMPAFAVRSLFASGKSMKKMARYFGVSETVMYERLYTVGITAAVNAE